MCNMYKNKCTYKNFVIYVLVKYVIGTWNNCKYQIFQANNIIFCFNYFFDYLS